jgi:hypothetical protein
MPPSAFLPLGRAHLLLHTLSPSKWMRPFLRLTQDRTGLVLLNTPSFLPVGLGYSYVDEKAKYLKYSTTSAYIFWMSASLHPWSATPCYEIDKNRKEVLSTLCFPLHDQLLLLTRKQPLIGVEATCSGNHPVTRNSFPSEFNHLSTTISLSVQKAKWSI